MDYAIFDTKMKRLRIVVHGRVQGVMYREFTRREAEKLGVTGYTRNLPDGTVEVIAEGEEKQLNELVQKCKKGPLLAFVEKLDIQEKKPTGEFEGFDIRYS